MRLILVRKFYIRKTFNIRLLLYKLTGKLGKLKSFFENETLEKKVVFYVFMLEHSVLKL